MLAHAFLTDARARAAAKRGANPSDSELIALSLPEIRHLLVLLIWAVPPEPQVALDRSHWRRKHLHRAKQHHNRAHDHAR